MPKINLENKQFEFFTVLSRNTERVGKNVWWNCQCVCGKIFIATTTDINRKVVKSCGCKRAELIGKAHLQDITGQVFGELEVLERNYELQRQRGSKNSIYTCRCSCGNIINVERAKLVIRGQSSCGCKNSIGELNICKLLSQNNIPYKKEYTNIELKTANDGYYRFDFAIFDNSSSEQVIRLIEFDGPQHQIYDNYFKDNYIFERDAAKNQYAKDCGIPLVRIPYSKRDTITIEDLLGDKFLVN